MKLWLIYPDGLHAWRWRALTVWVIAFTAVAVVLLQQNRHETEHAKRLAVETRIQNARQQAALVSLCNRGYISLGTIEVMIRALPRKYRNDLNVYRNSLVGQLTDKDSPCVGVTR